MSGPSTPTFRDRDRNTSEDQKNPKVDPRALTSNKDYSLGEFGIKLDLYNNSPNMKMEDGVENQVSGKDRNPWYCHKDGSMQHSRHDPHRGIEKVMNSGISHANGNKLGHTRTALFPTPPSAAILPDTQSPIHPSVFEAIKTSAIGLQRSNIRKDMLVTLSDLQKHVLDIFEIDDEAARSKFLSIMSGTFCALSVEKASSTNDSRERLATKLKEMIGHIGDVLGTISAEPSVATSTSPPSGTLNYSRPFWTMPPPPLVPVSPNLVKFDGSPKENGNQAMQHIEILSTSRNRNISGPQHQRRVLPASHAIRKKHDRYLGNREFHPHHFRHFRGRGRGQSSGHYQSAGSRYGQGFSPFDQDDRIEFGRFAQQLGTGRNRNRQYGGNSSTQMPKETPEVADPSRIIKSELSPNGSPV